MSSRRGDYDPTELFNKVGTVPSSAPSKHGRPHHRSHGGQKPPSGHPGGGQPQPHHGSHGHHRSSSSSSSQSGHNAVQTAASAPPGASGTRSTGSQHPMQHPISKHPNPAMQFDPNMRSSHREFLIYTRIFGAEIMFPLRVWVGFGASLNKLSTVFQSTSEKHRTVSFSKNW